MIDLPEHLIVDYNDPMGQVEDLVMTVNQILDYLETRGL